MNNRNNKPKKSSKLKHTIIHDRVQYTSPAKFIRPTELASGCRPKQPPNISYHHLQKKKQEIKDTYYVSGKQNKGRIMNNGQQQRQHSSILLETTDRFKEKRNTHHFIGCETVHHKLLEPKKINHQVMHNNETSTFKTNQKGRAQLRTPIPLGPFKSQHLKQSQKQNKPEKNERVLKKQFKQRPSYIAQADQCHLKCFQNLSTYSIAHSKTSFNNFGEISNMISEESNFLIEKQRTIQSRKAFHKSPKTLSPTAVRKIVEKTPQQEIAEFQAKINEINTNFQHDSLSYMQNKDYKHVQSKNLNRYLDYQMDLNWKRRGTVIHWMIEVLAQTGGKRETFANSVNIFDRYLSLTLNIPLDHVQCIAAGCLLIAAKLQDKSLSAYYLSQATVCKYTPEQILEEEFKILMTLKFFVNTPTLNSWVNRLALQWDLYLDNVDLRGYDIILSNLHEIKFKSIDQTSYYNFRWLTQYVDFAVLDICTLRYQSRMLSLAFIYLVMMMRLKLNTKERIISVFPNSSQFLLESTPFNDFFARFLKDSFNQELLDLLPMIQYCATFVILPLNFDLPELLTAQNNPEFDFDEDKKDEKETAYEDLCTYQTKNQHMLQSLFKRNRDVY